VRINNDCNPNLTSGLSNQLLRGLSRMLGNWQVRFLEGLGLVTAPGYSACLPTIGTRCDTIGI